MSGLKWTLIVLGLGMLVFSISKPAPAPHRSAKRRPPAPPPPEDKVQAALASADLDAMMAAATRERIAPRDRHLLLLGIIEKTYPQRQAPQMKEKFFTHARRYVEEFPQFLPELRSQSPKAVASTPVFKMLAIALTNEGRYDEAVAVCQRALQFGVEDGTKTGFAGRIERIQKLQKG